MGNSDDSFCKNSTCMCNIFPTKKIIKRNSLSLPKRNVDIKSITTNSITTKEYFQNQNQIENGGTMIDSNNVYKINLKDSKKQNKQFILLNPLKDNNRNKLVYASKSNTKNIENKRTSIFSKYNNRLNNTNNNRTFIISHLKYNFNHKDNYNINYNDKIEKNKSKENNNKLNTSIEEENTIINNCSLSSLSKNSINKINSINESFEENNQSNIKSNNKNDSKNNIENINVIIESNIKNNNNKINSNINIENIKEENECKKEKEEKYREINEINEFEEKEEITKIEGEINEKEIELLEKFNNSEENSVKNENENKEINNLIKSLKTHSFKFSQKPMIKIYNNHEISSSNINSNIKQPLIKDQNEQDDINLNTSNHSIPEYRHIDSSHPLNLLLIKRNFKSSLFPLSKKSFNVITYKEDSSEQYAFFENGVANGVTKFIISKKYKIVFEGFFEDGFPKGYGKYSLFDEGKYYEGIWNKTLLLGMVTYKDGTMYIGEFKNNKKEGIGMYRWPDGTIYSGEWKNDTMEGFCSIKYEDNRKYEGQMKNGHKNGYGEFTWKNVRKYFGYYVNDLKDGFGIYVWDIKTFEIYIGFWYKGKMEGIGMTIKGDRRRYGKWSRGEKIEKFKNARDLKLKYKSTEFVMATNLINQRVKVAKDNKKIFFDNNNIEMFKQRKSVVIKAKTQIEGCINFMCQDLKTIKNIILSFFLKPYSYA